MEWMELLMLLCWGFAKLVFQNERSGQLLRERFEEERKLKKELKNVKYQDIDLKHLGIILEYYTGTSSTR